MVFLEKIMKSISANQYYSANCLDQVNLNNYTDTKEVNPFNQTGISNNIHSLPQETVAQRLHYTGKDQLLVDSGNSKKNLKKNKMISK